MNRHQVVEVQVFDLIMNVQIIRHRNFIQTLARAILHSVSGYRCQNLEKSTFADNSFDLFITQHVMEYIFDYEAAFREIARVLKPGGAHIFTAPLVNKVQKSERWASRSLDGDISYHRPAEYHGNLVDSNGALVTMHWGYDIAHHIMEAANMPTVIIKIDDIDFGMRAEYIDVIVSINA